MSDRLDLDKDRFRLNPRYRLQWEEAQQCHVLLYPEGLIKLNDSAAEILRRCQDPVSCRELIATLQQAFPEADLAEDVRDFLGHASRQEWIVKDEDSSP